MRGRAFTQRDRKARQKTFRQGVAGAEPSEIKSVDDARVLKGDEVEHDRAILLIGIDMMEGKTRAGLRAPDDRAGLLVDHGEANTALGRPAVGFDERAPAQQQPQRLRHQRKFGEDQMPLAHSKTVSIGGLAGFDLGDDAAAMRARRHARKTVEGLAAEADFEIINELPCCVVMRMRGRDLAVEPIRPCERAEGFECFCINPHGIGRFRQGHHVVFAVGKHIHIAVVA